MLKKLTFLLTLGLSVPAKAQVALGPEEIPTVNQIIDSRVQQTTLKCDVRPSNPFLDFNFRYETGLIVSANLSQFTPHQDLIAYLRVTPQGSAPMLLQETFEIPAIQPDSTARVAVTNLKKGELEISSAFAIGPGRYAVEVLLLAGQRSCYKRWNVHTGKYSNEVLPLALSPDTVAPLAPESWDGKLDANGVRLTVLLDAAPMNPFAARLHAWDRSMLLQTLASLLKDVPCQSVQIVAFSLDQQREVFRQGSIDSAGFGRLAKALQQFEPAVIPYQALQPGNWLKFLLRLVYEQTSAEDPADVVVFLGHTSHFDKKVLIELPEPARSRFFYFEFSELGAHFPDAIERLTKELRGTVFLINSPNDFAAAVRKMLGQVRPTQSDGRLPPP